jgi:hypothetical protein
LDKQEIGSMQEKKYFLFLFYRRKTAVSLWQSPFFFFSLNAFGMKERRRQACATPIVFFSS